MADDTSVYETLVRVRGLIRVLKDATPSARYPDKVDIYQMTGEIRQAMMEVLEESAAIIVSEFNEPSEKAEAMEYGKRD
jgi:hypothetical protein